MKAEQLINMYLKEMRIKKIADVNEFRQWLELKFNKVMDRPLFIAKGKGGGQTYKTLWEVFDVLGNHNKPCYFYNENQYAIERLIAQEHLPLQHWIDNIARKL